MVRHDWYEHRFAQTHSRWTLSMKHLAGIFRVTNICKMSVAGPVRFAATTAVNLVLLCSRCTRTSILGAGGTGRMMTQSSEPNFLYTQTGSIVCTPGPAPTDPDWLQCGIQNPLWNSYFFLLTLKFSWRRALSMVTSGSGPFHSSDLGQSQCGDQPVPLSVSATSKA